MTKVLQKSAHGFRELHPSHRGLLRPGEFYDQFELRSYECAPELAPFVMYMWTQRWDLPEDPGYSSEPEIFTGPNQYLFFGKNEAFIHGIRTAGFDYEISGKKGVIAGVKFKPGGLYPFLRQPLTTLAERKQDTTELFPEATLAFSKRLLSQDDQAITRDLNKLLCQHLPLPDKNVELIGAILEAIAADTSLDTVRNVARRFRRSERNLQEIFQTYVGVGIKWVLMRNRLLRAAEYARMVARPDWLSIAHELGYSSQPHFVTDFKRTIGQTPSEYVRSLQ